MIYFLIFVSFSLSTVASVLFLKKTSNKWLAMFVAFCLNSLVLGTSTWIIYLTNDEVRQFGLGPTNVFQLILSIPIITWINLLILVFSSRRIAKENP